MRPDSRAGIDDSRACISGIKMQKCCSFWTRPYRLDGLGHRAFNAATRVRIPLGTPTPGNTPIQICFCPASSFSPKKAARLDCESGEDEIRAIRGRIPLIACRVSQKHLRVPRDCARVVLSNILRYIHPFQAYWILDNEKQCAIGARRQQEALSEGLAGDLLIRDPNFEIRGPGSCEKIMSANTDENGNFEIRNAPEGTYIFKASSLGFNAYAGKITLSRNAKTDSIPRIYLQLGF